jgi:Protein of unknown function (DUF2839)
MANSKRNNSKSIAKKSNAKVSQVGRAEQERLQEKILPWTSITRQQANQFVSITTTGAWVSIGILVLFWVTVRFIGPAFGWWVLAG